MKRRRLRRYDPYEGTSGQKEPPPIRSRLPRGYTVGTKKHCVEKNTDNIESNGGATSDIVDVAFDRCAHVIRNPDLWVVERPLKEDGNAVDDVWMNLHNGMVLLSSGVAQSCSVPVVCLKMAPSGCIQKDICTFDKDRMSFGYRDNSKGEVKLLFDMILQVQGSHSGQGSSLSRTTRRGSTLSRTTNIGESVRQAIFQRHLGAAASERRSREDRLNVNPLCPLARFDAEN